MDKVEVKPTWGLAWGIFWRMTLIGWGIYVVFGLIFFLVFGAAFFIPFMSGL